jgi:nucleoside 2-deoxyribosyltransferase
MRIYIAGPWAHRGDMPTIAEQLEQAGHTITWKWWNTPETLEGTNHDEELTRQAFHDKRGVEECQVLVLINSAKSEGKAFEQGVAVTQKKPIIAIGKLGDGIAKNVFHYLPNYVWVEDVQAAIARLESIQFVYNLYENVYAS